MFASFYNHEKAIVGFLAWCIQSKTWQECKTEAVADILGIISEIQTDKQTNQTRTALILFGI